MLRRSTCRRSRLTEALRQRGLAVSKATVYNTLNLFAAHGLIRQLVVDGARSCFDSNVQAHYHFHDETLGRPDRRRAARGAIQPPAEPPAGMEVAGLDLVIRLRPPADAHARCLPRRGFS